MHATLEPTQQDPPDALGPDGPEDLQGLIELELADLGDEPPDTELLRGGISASAVSVILHVSLILLLAGWTIDRSFRPATAPIQSRLIEDIEEEQPEEVVEYVLTDPDDRELDVREVVKAASLGQVKTTKPKVESPPELVTEMVPTRFRHRMWDIPERLELDEHLVVNGSTGESLVEIESALDRVTWEIANHLQERKVLVVWLLDASGSLTKQRQAIADRLKRVYGELGALEQIGQLPRLEQPLLSAVVAFGSKTLFLLDPTDQVDPVVEAVRNAPIDESGVENVFTAVSQVVGRWGHYRTQSSRRILLITVTDEAGDDFPLLETAIARCRLNGAHVYVIGPAAVFGRRDGYVPYVAPEDGKTYQLPIALGPETARLEAIQLPFWFDGPQYEYLSSGFGPYALSRLVRETGGVYFMTNMTTMAGLAPVGEFDALRLKPFEPDYRFGTPAEYDEHLRGRPLRQAVVTAAALARQFPVNGTPALELRVQPNNFKQIASEAQKSVAESELAIDNILRAFPDGIEKFYDDEPSPRWRMAFNLTYGRLLALKVRCLEYNYALAYLKNQRTPQDIQTRSNRWIFRPSPTINYATSTRRIARQAEELLKRCVDEAPGTPWAVLAARELQHPFGLEIVERYVPPVQRRPVASAPKKKKGGVLLLAQDKKKTPKKPAPKPAPPKLPKL